MLRAREGMTGMAMDESEKLKFCQECKAIVLRTYSELRDLGLEEESAFRSALRVLSLRHPERGHEDATRIVSQWIAAAGLA
jgi:hypothetical protein